MKEKILVAMEIVFEAEHGIYHFVCPHCKQGIEVFKGEMNCKIFRHGVFKKNMKQIPPHASKIKCDMWAKNDEIYGCGKPFRIVNDKGSVSGFKAETCGYI